MAQVPGTISQRHLHDQAEAGLLERADVTTRRISVKSMSVRSTGEEAPHRYSVCVCVCTRQFA